jgi:hypothetical protein
MFLENVLRGAIMFDDRQIVFDAMLLGANFIDQLAQLFPGVGDRRKVLPLSWNLARYCSLPSFLLKDFSIFIALPETKFY